jgi:uncharacterized protein YciI
MRAARLVAVVTSCLLCAYRIAAAAETEVRPTAVPDSCYVVLYKPGPAWNPAVSLTGQAGFRQHIQYLRKQLESGRFAMGGPFVDAGSGGMMVTVPGVTEAEIRAIEDADPAITTGILTYEIRHWLVAMKN